MPRVRAKAGLPWPVTGSYVCDKCHSTEIGEAGVIAARCTVPRGAQGHPCNCAYFVLVETPPREATSSTERSGPSRDPVPCPPSRTEADAPKSTGAS